MTNMAPSTTATAAAATPRRARGERKIPWREVKFYDTQGMDITPLRHAQLLRSLWRHDQCDGAWTFDPATYTGDPDRMHLAGPGRKDIDWSGYPPALEARNARRREARAAARKRREKQLDVVAQLARQLSEAGEDPMSLVYATIFAGGAAVNSGQPEKQVCYVELGEEGAQGWVGTQYQHADFSCRALRAAKAVAKDMGWGEILDEATAAQTERAIRLALAD